jgi:hypothetical protein
VAACGMRRRHPHTWCSLAAFFRAFCGADAWEGCERLPQAFGVSRDALRGGTSVVCAVPGGQECHGGHRRRASRASVKHPAPAGHAVCGRAPGATCEGAWNLDSSYPGVVLCIGPVSRVGSSAGHSRGCPLAFRVRDSLQCGLHVGQRLEDRAPVFVCILQAVVSLGRRRPMPGGMPLLAPFALPRFLQGDHHEVGFLHEFVDQVGPLPWCHTCLLRVWGYASRYLTE